MPRPSSANGQSAKSTMNGYPQQSANDFMGGEGMNRVATLSPTPSSSQGYYHPGYYPHPSYLPNMQAAYENIVVPGYPAAHGRMAIPLQGQQTIMAVNTPYHPGLTPSPHDSDKFGPSPFLPDSQYSPFGQPTQMPPMIGASPLMMASQHQISPADHFDIGRSLIHPQLQRTNTMPSMGSSTPYQLPPNFHHFNGHHQPIPGGSRPPLTQRHTMQSQGRPLMQRQHSSQAAGPRSANPHTISGDVFDHFSTETDTPVRRSNSSLGFIGEHRVSSNGPHMMYDYSQDMLFLNGSQGISPARALGPAPAVPLRFSPRVQNPLITPQTAKTIFPSDVHSSGTFSAVPTNSVSRTASVRNSMSSQPESIPRQPTTGSSDDEDESPTRPPSTTRTSTTMALKEQLGGSSDKGKASRPMNPRPHRQQAASKPVASKPVVSKSAVSGGRTSAKFEKVADDPGVEGVPPGPRPVNRPGPSFACIIGEGILAATARGLSLEHIYRYVETVYPFFKLGENAWRNSVRHNLSIHKMFETTPRTEAYPPGKGGIWIIHEEEKCHWPESGKFIKNFPVSHPHHAVCRQTLFERAKEIEAMNRAAVEGIEYVPKKGKKGRKLPLKGVRELPFGLTSGDMFDAPQLQRSMSQLDLQYAQQPSVEPVFMAGGDSTYDAHMRSLQPHPAGVPVEEDSLLTDFDVEDDMDFEEDMDFEDEGEFLPEELDIFELTESEDSAVEAPPAREDTLAKAGIMAPPRFEGKQTKRLLQADEEGIFSSSKRVRLPGPLAPIIPHPQPTVIHDSFITPQRTDRPGSVLKTASSAFKTPALINTTSSPGSSPMPPTITRSSHHPSALQQAWTHADIAQSASSSSPPRAMLDAAFDIKPKQLRSRPLDTDDDFTPSVVHDQTNKVVPKTPVSRSSAAVDRTPRYAHNGSPRHRTPSGPYAGSPMLPPPSAKALMSTPLWEIGGCLDRLKDYVPSPTWSVRSPKPPPTSPTSYAMLLDNCASPRKRDPST